MSRVEKDFEDFIKLLNQNDVEYMIVGAYALTLYSRPRNTGDIDIYINDTGLNAVKVLQTLKDFGFEDIGITTDDLTSKGKIVQLGVSPVRIDIMNDIDGIVFNEAYQKITKINFGNIVANFISLEDLIKNKRSSNRKKDQADLEELMNFYPDK